MIVTVTIIVLVLVLAGVGIAITHGTIHGMVRLTHGEDGTIHGIITAGAGVGIDLGTIAVGAGDLAGVARGTAAGMVAAGMVDITITTTTMDIVAINITTQDVLAQVITVLTVDMQV